MELTVSALGSFHEIGIHAYFSCAEPISNPSFRRGAGHRDAGEAIGLAGITVSPRTGYGAN
jgi:hypothetical protein